TRPTTSRPSTRVLMLCRSLPRSPFFFNAPASAAIYTLSLHDALPIFQGGEQLIVLLARADGDADPARDRLTIVMADKDLALAQRSEEHTSGTPVTWPSRMPSSA